MVCLDMKRYAQIWTEMMERDGLGLVADSVGLERLVRLVHWLDLKWTSEREKIGWTGSLGKFRKPK